MVYDGIIQGKTVILRSVDEKDTEITYKMRTDPQKSRFVHPICGNGTLEDQREFIIKQRKEPMDYMFVIEDLLGNPIGMKGLYSYDSDKNMITSGRFLGFGNQIQNMESLKLSYDFAFEYMKVNRILMSTYSDNSQMLNIQKGFGAEIAYTKKVNDGRNSVVSILTREKYDIRKSEIEVLINRFAKRMNK